MLRSPTEMLASPSNGFSRYMPVTGSWYCSCDGACVCAACGGLDDVLCPWPANGKDCTNGD